jgi:glycosyltransferase involved in cell wall biosynthesis
MKIIAYVNKDSGPAYHRLIMPLMIMPGVDVYITNNLLDEHFEKGCDLFIYNRILPHFCLADISRLKDKYGFKICVDVDDYWELDEHHILYKYYQDNNFATQQISQILAADFVTTTHTRLAEEIGQYNRNVHVLPNAIPKQGQFNIMPNPSHLTRLFWQGSVTHEEDINLLKTPVERLLPIAGKIKMVIAGYHTDEQTWHNMALTYTFGCKHQYKLLPALPVTNYYEHYKEADICLVPLINSRFNRMKSNLKVLEAANLGLPVIASAVHPYLNMPLVYCKSGEDWVKNIERLSSSKKRQQDAGAELAEFCSKHYNFNKINKERKQIYESRK